MQKGSTLKIISINYLKCPAFINTYKYQYFPLPDEKMWPLVLHDNLQPSVIIKSVGRPQIKMRKEADEPATFKRSQVSNVLSVSIKVITREPTKEQKYLANKLIIISLSFSS